MYDNNIYGDFADTEKLTAFFIEEYLGKNEAQSDEEWLFQMLRSQLPDLSANELRCIVDEVTAAAVIAEETFDDIKKAYDIYGQSPETWLYHRIMHRRSDGDDDFKQELVRYNSVLSAANRALLDRIYHVNAANRKHREDDNRDNEANVAYRAAVDEMPTAHGISAEEKRLLDGETIGTGFKKSFISQYQRALRIDLAHVETTEVARSITRNTALSGVGGLALAAGMIVVASAGRNGAMQLGRRQLMLSMLKAGSTTGLRTAVAGALKVGAERNMLPLITRATPA